MLKIIAGVTAAVFFSAVACLLVIHSQGPSTAQLDGDLAAVQASISDTQSDEARFANGLILTEIQLRLEILENTRAMLDGRAHRYTTFKNDGTTVELSVRASSMDTARYAIIFESIPEMKILDTDKKKKEKDAL